MINMATFKDLFHYGFNRNAVFTPRIPLEPGGSVSAVVHKVELSANNCKRIAIDINSRPRYIITLHPDDEIQITQFPAGNLDRECILQTEPIYTDYFPIDTGINYMEWKQYDNEGMMLMIAIICKDLDDTISEWLNEDHPVTETPDEQPETEGTDGGE